MNFSLASNKKGAFLINIVKMPDTFDEIVTFLSVIKMRRGIHLVS